MERVNSPRRSAGERARTVWRRTLFLLLGGLVAIPYALLVTWAVTLLVEPRFEDPAGAAAVGVSVLIILVVLATPAFLTVTRTLERTAANQLLDLDVPEPGHRATATDRLRAAVFFGGHVVSGAALVFALGFCLPAAITIVVDAAAGSSDGTGIVEAALPWLAPGTAIVLAVVVSVLAVALVVVSGILLPWYARMLLGPSAEEQLEAANRATADLERRNELARELHDSIGHALTLTTVQAAAAGRLIDRDPAAARAAIAEVERAGRTAVADLDYALRVLRTPPGERVDASSASRPIDDLVDDARAAGTDVEYVVHGDATGLPASMRSALYRVAQEALTNALRHASEPRVAVSLTIGAGEVVLRVVNPAEPARSERGPSADRRGLRGIRERVALLGGTSTARRRGDEWLLEVVLPLGGAP